MEIFLFWIWNLHFPFGYIFFRTTVFSLRRSNKILCSEVWRTATKFYVSISWLYCPTLRYQDKIFCSKISIIFLKNEISRQRQDFIFWTLDDFSIIWLFYCVLKFSLFLKLSQKFWNLIILQYVIWISRQDFLF